MNVAIIGGTGGMGKTFARFFDEHGISTMAIGRRTKNPIEVLNGSDVIVLSLPSPALDFAISLLGQINLRGKLVISLGSIMTHDRKRLSRLGKFSLLHIHQLFGPSVYPFVDQNIVISGDTKDGFARAITKLLKEDGTNIIEMTPKEHDQTMAIVQAISQFSTIVLAKTISEIGHTKKDLLRTSTVTFRKNVESIERVMMQKPELWSFLQFENPFALKIMKRHSKNVQEMMKLAQNKNYKKFEKEFSKISEFWK